MNKFLIAAIAAAFTLASCSSESDAQTDQEVNRFSVKSRKVLSYKALR